MPDYKYINEYPELIERLQGLSIKIKEQEEEMDKLVKERLYLLDIINEKNVNNFQNLTLINDLENKNKNLQNINMNLEKENNNLKKENKFLEKENNNLKKQIEFYKEKVNKYEYQINQFINKGKLLESKIEIWEKKNKILNEENANLKNRANFHYYENLKSINLSSKLSIMNKKLMGILKANNLEDEIKKLK